MDLSVDIQAMNISICQLIYRQRYVDMLMKLSTEKRVTTDKSTNCNNSDADRINNNTIDNDRPIRCVVGIGRIVARGTKTKRV